jgi:hypothetical protein
VAQNESIDIMGGAMCIDGKLRRVRSWKRAALQASAYVVMSAACSSLVGQADVWAQARAGAAQSTSEDPCRFATAEVVGKAFGRPMQASKHVGFCQYGGTPTGLVVVRVKAGPEGTILRHAKSVIAQGQKGVEKVPTTAGEAYFESILPAFIGRVGNYDVQIETTIEPVPRDAMIAVGTRIMETLAGK